jgi:Tfp pilus assembly protein PilV
MMNKKGTSLVETICAVLIFAIVIGAIINIFTQSTVMSNRGQYIYTAYNLAKNHAERLKTFQFSSLTSANETLTRLNADGEPDASGEYLRTTTVTIPYNADSDLARVTVNVFYEIKGVRSPDSMDAETVFFNGG